MKKTRVISLALVAMLFFSLTAFTPAARAVKAGSNLGTHISFKAKDSCAGHNYITTQYGKWQLVKTTPYGTFWVTYTYEREVTEVCTKCASVKTHKETKYVHKWLDIEV